MKFAATAPLVGLVFASTTAVADAFTTTLTPKGTSTRSMAGACALQMSSSASSSSSAAVDATTPFVQPARVVRDDSLPTLYVYDHCPFCVRVRVALGLKNVKHTLHFLANDDVATPTALIGKKMAPIFAWPEAQVCMGESLDIIALCDGDLRLGPTGVIKPATDRTDLKAWQGGVRDLLRALQRPRYVATGLLPEFQQQDARHAFVANHQLPGYTKDEWKNGDMALDDKLTMYAALLAKDPTADLAELNRQLQQLDALLHCEFHASEGGLCMDDVDLFSRLRSITIIQGVTWPTKLRSYMDYMAKLSDVPLYDAMAL